jgi:2,4-dienoyl-CoA reductase (NADPH2)
VNALPLVRAAWSIGGLALPHRIVMGSMHTGLETRDDGGAALAAFYRERVEGGAALVITGGLAVSDEARGGPDYAVLGDPAANTRLAAAAAAVHAAGGFLAAQLFHAGRYALLAGLTDSQGDPAQAVAPSAVPWRAARGAVPRALSEEEIAATIRSFADAARAAAAAGVDAVEIMASEGYLLNQFLSPRTNLRDDAWGGDAERRRRFPLAVLAAVRDAIDVPVIVRLSGDDLMPDSSTPDDVLAFARALVAGGADALSVGMGWHESRVPTVQAAVPHGAWLRWTERIARALREDAALPRVPVIVSNRITSLAEAERILARGAVDAVALARPFLADPALVATTFAGTPERVMPCIGCDQACIDRSLVFEPVSCLVNPRAGRETEFPLPVSVEIGRGPASVAVVGAGPAGLAAALDLARRGRRVTLWEERAHLGGQFELAGRIPGKEDYADAVRASEAELRARGADIRLGRRATVAELAGADGVVLASGVRPRVVDIPGADLPHVLDYERALRDGVPAGTVAIIGGGGIGVDTAAFLVESHDPAHRAAAFGRGHGLAEPTDAVDTRPAARAPATRPGETVTVLRRAGRFGDGIGITSRWVAVGALAEAGVRMLAGIVYRRITPAGVEVEHPDGTVELIPGETVIVCAGQVSHAGLADELAAAGIRFEIAGGARDASKVDAVRATSEGLAAARRISA